MASTYAHYRFGQEVYESLPIDSKIIINENKTLYDIGLHGPDILFYYKALISNPINQIGYGMHQKPAREFFASALSILKKMDKDNVSAGLAYIYGFICHFALDSACHPYIEEKIQSSGITHTEIEVEFDRELMEADGLQPLTQSLTEHILPSAETSRIISAFFSPVSPAEIKQSLESMKHYNQMLLAPSRLKRGLIYGLLGITGNYKEMHGLFVNYKPNPNCADSSGTLLHLYQSALSKARRLIEEYMMCLTEQRPLPSVYDHTFGPD